MEFSYNSLNFLNLNIKIISDRLKADTSQKPTYSENIISNRSFHPYSTKTTMSTKNVEKK